jgi:hypothetical protein
VREVRRRAGLAPGSLCGHVEVRLVDDDGWNRSGHVRRRAGGLVSGVCSGLLTTVGFNPRAQGASRGAKESTRARNRRKTHRGARSTYAGDLVKSGDVDPVSPAR